MKLSEDAKSRAKLFKFLLRHMAIGIFFGWVILSAFLILDVGGLRTLSKATHAQAIVYPLLYIFFAITFGSVGMGIGIMTMNKDDDDDHKGGGKRQKTNIANDWSYGMIPAKATIRK